MHTFVCKRLDTEDYQFYHVVYICIFLYIFFIFVSLFVFILTPRIRDSSSSSSCSSPKSPGLTHYPMTNTLSNGLTHKNIVYPPMLQLFTCIINYNLCFNFEEIKQFIITSNLVFGMGYLVHTYLEFLLIVECQGADHP